MSPTQGLELEFKKTHIDTAGDITVLDQVVGRQYSIVGLDNGLGDFGRGEDRECSKHPIGVLLPDLG
jgi:hypothetical protein